MRIVIELPSIKQFVQRGGSEQGFPEARRTATVRVLRAIKTDRGHGKLVITAHCVIYDRKKPWKAGKYLTMPQIRERAKANRAIREQLQKLNAVNAQVN